MRLTKCVPLGVGFKLAWAVFIQTKISKMLRFLASCVTVSSNHSLPGPQSHWCPKGTGSHFDDYSIMAKECRITHLKWQNCAGSHPFTDLLLPSLLD
jgi:hypothetical protein